MKSHRWYSIVSLVLYQQMMQLLFEQLTS